MGDRVAAGRHRLRFLLVALATAAAALSVASAIAQSVAPSPAAAPPPAAPQLLPPQSVGSVYPAPPEDPRSAKVYAIFDQFCARCHQSGKLKIPAAAKPLANILALDDVARTPTLVTPSLPDASPLYTVLLRAHPALELDSLPGNDAIQAIRDWIVDLPPSTGTCSARAVSRQTDTEAEVLAALAPLSEAKRRDLRFITIGHLADACVSAETIAAYRQAITKVINTLSWGPEPIRLQAIDLRGTILKFDLAELGWVPAHWDKLVLAYPYANLASSRLSETVRLQTGTATPVVRGDWLAHAAMGTPLYASLLGLPGRMVNLQRILNIDIDASIAAGKARRAGVVQSAVTRANRLVERHPTQAGSLWIAYDFATSEGRQNLLTTPLGPTATATVKVPFKHDGTRSLFTLPNGFFAYSLNDPRGDRLDASPEVIDRDEVAWAGAPVNGASCMGCHMAGPIAIKDVVRAAVLGDASQSQAIRDTALQLYAPQTEIDSLIAEDQERYANAQRKAGIDPSLLVAGLEPVMALAREYTREVGEQRLAAEAGLSLADARLRLLQLPAELTHAGRRVMAAVASRADADRIITRLAPDAGSTDAAIVVAAPVEPRTELELLLWSRSDVYQSGELATFYARSNQPCYLTLVSLDRTGQATILFPNEFEPNNLLSADTDLTLPSESASYQFRVRDRGRETLVGICQTGVKSPEGIQHDFERQRFTMLGDWRAHLAKTPIIASKGRTSVEPAARAKTPRQSRARAELKPDGKSAPMLQARTAITYEVR